MGGPVAGLITRKVRPSNGSLLVALPLPWCRANGVGPGDELELLYRDAVIVRVPRQQCPDCGAPVETIRVGEFMGEPIWGYRCRRCGFREGGDDYGR